MKLDQNTTTVHIFRTGNLLLSQDLGPSRDQWLSFFSILPQTLVGRICTWPFNRTTSPAMNLLAKGTSSPTYTTYRSHSWKSIARVGIHNVKQNIRIIVPFQPTPTYPLPKIHPSRSPLSAPNLTTDSRPTSLSYIAIFSDSDSMRSRHPIQSQQTRTNPSPFSSTIIQSFPDRHPGTFSTTSNRCTATNPPSPANNNSQYGAYESCSVV